MTRLMEQMSKVRLRRCSAHHAKVQHIGLPARGSRTHLPISNRTAHDDMDRCFGLLEFLEPEDETGTIVTARASSTHYFV